MDSINTFEKYGKALKESDYDISAMNISPEDIKCLQNEVVGFTDEIMKSADRVLSNYYSMKVPYPMIKEILIKDIELAYEVYSKGVGDTCQRGILVDSVLRHMGMRDWPIYGEGDEVMKDFVIQLKENTKSFGIELVAKD